MRVLMTGGSGFLGARLGGYMIGRCIERVINIGRSPSLHSLVHSITVPDLVPAVIDDVLGDEKFDVVLHLAAAGVDPDDRDVKVLTRINRDLPGWLVAFAAARGAKAVLLTGSSAEYRPAPPGTLLTEDMPLEAEKTYGASKAAGGQLALEQGVALGLPVAVIRIFNIYGPGEAKHRLLPSLIRSLKDGKPALLSPGTQVRDFVYADDVCNGLWMALAALMEGRMASGAYNLCTGHGTSVADFARAVAQRLKLPEDLLQFDRLPLRPDDLPYVVGDPSRLQAACGWRPVYDVQAGISAAMIEQLSPARSLSGRRS